jgi:hypothetical protein
LTTAYARSARRVVVQATLEQRAAQQLVPELVATRAAGGVFPEQRGGHASRRAFHCAQLDDLSGHARRPGGRRRRRAQLVGP